MQASRRRTVARRSNTSAWLRPCVLLLLTATGYAAPSSIPAAYALSEIKPEETPVAPPGTDGITPPATTVPMPGQADPAPPAGEPGADQDVPGDPARPDPDSDGPLPEIIYNLDRLPEPVRRMHNRLVEAAKSGDIEKLRPLIQPGADGTQLSFGDVDSDPVEFLKGLSGDPEGQEILAILEEVLNAGYVHLDAGSAEELYVWPYFFAIPLDKLDARQRVELFKIVTFGDYEGMKTFNSYIFYRLGIGPDGTWAFFVAGD